jgi:thioredoxin-like negative regulator of GroEL
VAQVGRFDVDHCQDTARPLGVGGIPDVRFFLNGKQVDSFIGGLSEADVREKFKAHTSGLAAAPKAAEAPKTEPTIQRMPKDWMPPGLKRG